MTHIVSASTPTAVYADPARAFADHQTRIETLRPTNKAAIFDALAAAGITQVEVTFDSYGDSGQVEDITARSANEAVLLPEGEVRVACPAWGCTHVETRTMTVAAALEHLVYDCLSEAHPGWENGDGAYGTFTFDVAVRTITLDHHARHVAVKSTAHEF
jgi:hypothetical protein